MTCSLTKEVGGLTNENSRHLLNEFACTVLSKKTGAPDLRAVVTQFHTIRQDEITGKAKRGSSFTLVENFRVLRSRDIARVYHYVATTWEAYAPGYVNTETAMVKYKPAQDAKLVEMVLAKQKCGKQPGWYKAWSAMRSSANNPPRLGGGNNPPRPADGNTNLSANAAGKLPAITIMNGATSNPAFCGIGGISGVAFVRNLTRLLLIRSICGETRRGKEVHPVGSKYVSASEARSRKELMVHQYPRRDSVSISLTVVVSPPDSRFLFSAVRGNQDVLSCLTNGADEGLE
ncbi:unnamed protein product [Zymoseptoria tritici ST99CH_3D1]|nr:unnamed protein product [Zymoseptoria tritici ST99CH_3D1]